MNEYGDDFVTLTDEDGKEYELEVLATVEYAGATYKALCPADAGEDEDAPLEVSILKVVEEDGEEFLVTLDDEDEEEAVYELFLEQEDAWDDEEEEDGGDEDEES